MAEIVFELATPEDDGELRCLLRQNTLPGAISVSFEREPNYFTGAKVEGPFHQTIVARDQSVGRIIAMGSRSIRDLYLNGAARSVGYLSQMRISPGYRAMRKALSRGFEFLRTLHQDGRTRLYFSTIIEENLPAHRLFAAGLPGLPRFQEHGRMHTLALYCRRKRRALALPGGLLLTRGSLAHADAIVDCLQRNGCRFQLAPYWTKDTLFNADLTPDLAAEDFFSAMDGERVVGCLALWDQSSFKQAVVRGYSGRLARWRRLMNVGASIAALPTLPPANTPIRHCYASHLAVEDDNPDIFAGLVRNVYNCAVDRGYSYCMLGLSDNHPLLESLVSTYPHIDYRSVLYVMAWEQEVEVLSELDGRVPGIEVSTL